MAADARIVLGSFGDHGGDVIEPSAAHQHHSQVLGDGGFAAFGTASDEGRHALPSTVKLSPLRISSR